MMRSQIQIFSQIQWTLNQISMNISKTALSRISPQLIPKLEMFIFGIHCEHLNSS